MQAESSNELDVQSIYVTCNDYSIDVNTQATRISAHRIYATHLAKAI